ncbi:hypothetical protein QFC21_003110 [Naganishia friedmannii]|uniref:Uncharacterized protein n=1 Tax=Naganishia friedmannii TaxID=89922 RepID=A0ACC2VSZ0_9TREE|nr:hypothetical protein QFC21_003110 [Naganishia friedmannii]
MSGSMPILAQEIPAKARLRADRLINLDDFYTHVRHCQCAFGVGLAVAIIGQVIRMPDMAMIWGILPPSKWKKGWWVVEGITWMIGIALLTDLDCETHSSAKYMTGITPEVPNVFDYDGCCLLSFIFIGYALHIAVLSATKDKLDISDLPHLTYAQRAENIVLPLEGRMFVPKAHTLAMQGGEAPDSIGRSPKKDVVSNVGPWQLAKLLWRGTGGIVMTNIVFEWAKVLAGFIPPYCLHEMVKSFDDPTSKDDKSYPLLMCGGLFVGMFSETLLATYVGAMLNISLFSKILRSVDAKAAEAERSTEKDGNNQGRAQILNLLLIDGKRVGELGYRAFLISDALLSFIVGVVFLYMMFGWAAFIGMAVIPLAVPFSYWISVYRYRVDRDLSRAQDARVSAIHEFLLSVKVIKLNAWDEHFIKRISVLRDKEIRLQRKRFHIGTGFNIISDQLPLLSILVIFFTYTKIMGQTLEPATAFVAMAVFGKVKAAISLVPDVISALLLARISLGRLGRYFSEPEVTVLGQGTSSNGRIRLKQATVGWSMRDLEKEQIDESTEQIDFRLYNMTVDIPQNALTLVSGPLGSGKTLFLLALLGEAKLLSGEIESPRSNPNALPLPEDLVDIEFEINVWLNPSMAAYSSQINYVKHGNIRDNILNGLPMWHERYAAVLRQCALIPDLKLFDHADLTEVGEQGVTLVSPKTIYLDDVLSAVDAHTARHLYQQCLKGDLLKNRTIVLVSHNVNLVLPSAQYVVHIENGTIDKSGPAADFTYQMHDNEESDRDVDRLLDTSDPVELDAVPSAEIPSEIRRIYEEEKREIGQVDRRNYAFLFKCAGGVIYWSIFTLIYGGAEFFNFLQTLWLKYWTGDGRPERLGLYLTGYAIIVTVGILIGAFRWLWLYGIRFRNTGVGFTDSAAPRIHDLMLRRLVGSPLALFTSWPTGRLLNRFSGDISQIDGSVPDNVGRSFSAGKEISQLFQRL